MCWRWTRRTRAGSVALVDDDRVVDERAGDASRTHGARLPAELAELGAPWPTIDVFAVASGPGSFTGLRIGIATMQGLALVTGRGVVGVSALDALAQLASADVAPGTLIASWIDAQRGEVFSALYQVTDAPVFTPERLVELEAPAAASPDATAGGVVESRSHVRNIRRRRRGARVGDRGPQRQPRAAAAGGRHWAHGGRQRVARAHRVARGAPSFIYTPAGRRAAS